MWKMATGKRHGFSGHLLSHEASQCTREQMTRDHQKASISQRHPGHQGAAGAGPDWEEPRRWGMITTGPPMLENLPYFSGKYLPFRGSSSTPALHA